MNSGVLTFIITPFILAVLMWLGVHLRKRFSKPKSENEVQRPGKFNIFILRFITLLAIFCAIPMGIGLIMGAIEMGTVFSVMAIMFGAAAVIIKREYDMSYHENDEYFILKAKNKKYHVLYENIIDWQPSYNEIKVLDESRTDGEYIRVSIAIIKPEIFLRKITKMTFEGRFPRMDDKEPNDPNREHEITGYLINNGYGYLVKD